VRPDEILRLAPAIRRVPGAGLVADLRSRLARRAAALREPRSRAMAAALLVGDRSGLTAADRDLFTRAGVRHLLAVSGLHVAILAALLLGPLAALQRALLGRRFRSAPAGLARAILLVAYVPLAGASAPVTRAGIAVALTALAPLSPRGGRRPDGLSLWSAALLVECLIDPRAASRLSVQLSYLAILGLILGCRPLLAIAGRALRIDPIGRGGRPRPAALRVPALLCLRGLGSGLAASMAASLTTLPVLWTRFGEWSPVGMAATPLLLPLLALLLASGWLELLAPGLAGPVFDLGCRTLTGSLELLDRLPGTPCPLPLRPDWLLLAAVIATLSALAGRVAAGRLAALLWGAVLLPWTPAPSGVELAALDVGHGTAVVLRAPGEPCWIFDAGSRDRPGVARGALAPILRRWEASAPAVVLSHAHRDHASALGWLVERYPPRSWSGACPAWLMAALPLRAPRRDVEPGRTGLASRGPVSLHLVRGLASEENEGSRTLVASWEGGCAVLCGDAEGEGLRRALEGGLLPERASLLLIPHHGSDTPLLADLLRRCAPEEVWVSSGAEVPVGPELDRRGLRWSHTLRDGPLELAPD